MTRYALHHKQKTERLVDHIHETRIDAPSLQAFRALAAVQGLSVRGGLQQLIEQHAVIREPFGPRVRAQHGREGKRYAAVLPGVEVAPDVGLALLIDANRAGIRMTEAVRQLVWRCVLASG